MNFGNIIRAKTSWSGLADPSMPDQHRLLPADTTSSKHLHCRFSGSNAKHSALAAWGFGERGYPSLTCLAAPGYGWAVGELRAVYWAVGAPRVLLAAAAPRRGSRALALTTLTACHSFLQIPILQGCVRCSSAAVGVHMAGCVATVLNAKAERTMCVVAKGARNLSCWKAGERQRRAPRAGIATAERGWARGCARLREAVRAAQASELH